MSSFRGIRGDGMFYVDKTHYIAELEATGPYLFFVRPPRFGKSLFVNTLEEYYDVKTKNDFEILFKGLVRRRQFDVVGESISRAQV